MRRPPPPTLGLAGLLLLAGSSAAGELPVTDPAAAELGRLLAEQASAIERYDFDAYLATFTAERRQAEGAIFRRLRQLPLVEVEMQIEEAAPPASTADERRRVDLRYRFAGHADNPFHHVLDVAFVRRGGVWRVGTIDDRGGRPVPWRQGELAVHRTHHFLISTHPRLRSDLIELAADAEAAYAALYQRGLPLAAGYVVRFAAGAEEFRRVAGVSRPNVLGVAVARYVLEGGRTTVDSRALYVNGPLFTERARLHLTPEARRATVTHELVHLALAAWTRPFTPPWLKEGTAVYFSGDLSFDANRALVRRGLDHLSLERMTRAAALGEHDATGRQAADEYLFAGNVVAYLVAEHGVESLLELYRSYAERPFPRPPAGAGAAGVLAASTTEEVLGRRYGLSVASLEAAVKEWLAVRHR